MFEIASVIILGILAQWVAWRSRVPAILPLIIIGLLVGPFSPWWTPNGTVFLQPIFQADSGRGLFPGKNLFAFVSLAIGIILFEGSLTLKWQELQRMGPAIIKLISIGSLVTFIGGGAAAHWLVGLSWPMSLMFSSLIIVTGPTVIAPILRNTPLSSNVATLLKWESILIDPVGAFVAVIVYEIIVSTRGGQAFSGEELLVFLRMALTGMALGSIGAYAFYQIIKKEWVPPYLLNPFALGYVLFVFVVSNLAVHESGLLSMVVMGVLLANADLPRLKEVLHFKESLTILLVSVLFILLAANIKLADLDLILDNPATLVLFALVVLLLRPLAVLLSTLGDPFVLREKIFVALVGPRGIVAAGIASLLGQNLVERGLPGAKFITPLVLLVVVGTVFLVAVAIKPLARLLRVVERQSQGILLLGANLANRLIGQYFKSKGQEITLVDLNEANIQQAQKLGLNALTANIYNDDLETQLELSRVGFLLALTGNPEVNAYALRKLAGTYGENGAYRFLSPEERSTAAEQSGGPYFSPTDDYLNFQEIARDYPHIHELQISTEDDLAAQLAQITWVQQRIPLVIWDKAGNWYPLPADFATFAPSPGQLTLAYLGKKIESL